MLEIGCRWEMETPIGKIQRSRKSSKITFIILFRKFQLYENIFPEEINLESMRVYAASYGGPIALTKDINFIKKTTVKPLIYIFTSSGSLLSKINASFSNY